MRKLYLAKRVPGFCNCHHNTGDYFSCRSQVPSGSTRLKHAPIQVHRNPDSTPAHGLRNQWLSGNWSGYELANFQTGQKYTHAGMTWVVPTVTYGACSDSTSSSEYSANWVGIGGFIQMEDSWGQTSNPSSANGLAGFDACWGYTTLTACPTP